MGPEDVRALWRPEAAVLVAVEDLVLSVLLGRLRNVRQALVLRQRRSSQVLMVRR